MTTAPPDAGALRRRLSGLTLRDEARLRRRIDRARGDEAALRSVAGDLAVAEQAVAHRRAGMPEVSYPAALPIAARTGDIAAAIAAHQVVVVAGETGSGKTTQLPKICLELGRGVRGMIGHTQPRRLAARTVAERIAEEVGSDVGDVVGYQMRFSERVSDRTLVKLMTDGILLASIGSDPLLRAYDTVIVDEAHERSLNVDFLLGYLAQLLPRRRDLKLIITSATIDPDRFARHFGGAPVVEVSGRMFPVEVRYRPLDGEGRPGDDDADDEDDQPRGERDQIQGICDAVAELRGERPGDVLVFCSGEREIRDTADALAELNLADTEILPLYARLSPAQQQRVFAPHTSRRIVLATNIAETSLTVPGIRYVVDPGTARISRYSSRLKVQRLPIEKISRASADQRTGRCGRTADGICIRLYSEEDFLARQRFTEPEILRTNLASVLLQMAALDLGDVADFPFLDPPDARQIRDGLALLEELGALAAEGDDGARSGRRRRPRGRRAGGVRLTPVGRMLARLPVDPRMGRMIVEADRNGCLDEVLVIAAALSIPDPRLRPPDAQQAADALHARFADERSDFLTFLNLWHYVRTEQRERSSNQFRKLCHAEYLHHLRVREWQDLYAQLRQAVRDLGMRRPSRRMDGADEVDAALVHRSLLAGLLSHVGMRDGDGRDYRGARGARLAIQPGSVLFRSRPRWIMAAELVETTRLWARTVARIQPEWVEQAAGHLVTRTYADPRWDPDRGGAVADETVRLYGLPLIAGRRVDYGRIDPPLARSLFIREALIDGRWETPHEFWHRNRARLEEVARLEDKLRRRDIVVDEDALEAFYDARIPENVVGVRHFDRWWREARREQPDLLDLPYALLLGDDAATAGAEAFPDDWQIGGLTLRLSYRFDPGADDDGVTVHVPLAVLHRIPSTAGSAAWFVPGLRRDIVTELLRSLPKDLRRRLVPVPDTAAALAARLDRRDELSSAALGDELHRLAGVDVPAGAWRFEALPAHLRPGFRVQAPDGAVLAFGRDLARLQRELAPQVRSALTRAAGDLERSGMTRWDVGALPRTVVRNVGDHAVTGYPALVDEGRSVGVRVFGDPGEQRAAMWGGTRRLLLIGAGSPVAAVHRRLGNAQKLALARSPHGSLTALLDDAVAAALDELLLRTGGPVWDAEAFAALQAHVRRELPDLLTEVLATVARILPAAADLSARLDTTDLPALQPAVEDLRAQLAGLVHAGSSSARGGIGAPGFISVKGVRRLADVARYVEAMRHRLDRLPRDVAGDRRRMDRIHEVQRAHRALLDRLTPARRLSPDVRELAWMIEELRVGEFAQSLGTAYRVSPERVLRAIDDAGA